MAHRFNCNTDRKEPKPSASERTKFRWRVYHGLETTTDENRITKAQQLKDKIKDKKESAVKKVTFTVNDIMNMLQGRG